MSNVSERFGKVGTIMTLVGGLLGVLVLLIFVVSGMVVVENRKAAVLIRKTGEDLKDGAILATADHKGIQADLLPEGWYWRNPYTWDHVLVDQIEIPPGKVGVQVRTFGNPLPEDAVIAEEGQRGIIRDVLRPGRYVINPYAYRVVLYEATAIPPGYLGVLTLVSGKEPKNPNEFLVEEGERGTQKHTLGPGTYYENPFIKKIIPIDV